MNKRSCWSDSNIRVARLPMLESKDQQQFIDSGGALDVTFAEEIAAHG